MGTHVNFYLELVYLINIYMYLKNVGVHFFNK